MPNSSRERGQVALVSGRYHPNIVGAKLRALLGAEVVYEKVPTHAPSNVAKGFLFRRRYRVFATPPYCLSPRTAVYRLKQAGLL